MAEYYFDMHILMLKISATCVMIERLIYFRAVYKLLTSIEQSHVHIMTESLKWGAQFVQQAIEISLNI
jgi:hypothetical protein